MIFNDAFITSLDTESLAYNAMYMTYIYSVIHAKYTTVESSLPEPFLASCLSLIAMDGIFGHVGVIFNKKEQKSNWPSLPSSDTLAFFDQQKRTEKSNS